MTETDRSRMRPPFYREPHETPCTTGVRNGNKKSQYTLPPPRIWKEPALPASPLRPLDQQGPLEKSGGQEGTGHNIETWLRWDQAGLWGTTPRAGPAPWQYQTQGGAGRSGPSSTREGSRGLLQPEQPVRGRLVPLASKQED